MKKKVFIQAPCSPSKLIKREFSECYKVSMSCGGGFGGSQWYEYVKSDIPLGEEKIVEVKNIFGDTIRINTRYAVSSKRMKVVHEEWDTLPWANFRREEYKWHITKLWYCVNLESELIFNNPRNKEEKPIKSYVDCEEI